MHCIATKNLIAVCIIIYCLRSYGGGRQLHSIIMYCICGLFGGDFNLVVWQITSGSPNLSHAILIKQF